MTHNRQTHLIKILPLMILFIFSFVTYFYVGTKGKFVIKQELDYYNALAKAFREGHLDIKNPLITDELSFYKGKWYPYYGPLPAFLMMFLQVVSRKEFVPTLYPNVFVAAANICLMYILLKRLKKEFFPKEKHFSPIIFTLVFAFGTVHFWLGSRSGIWFVLQIQSFFMSTLGLFFLVKQKRTMKDYFLSIFFISAGLFARPSTILILSFPLLLFIFDHKKIKKKKFLRELIIIFTPFLFFISLFGLYNYLRFDNPLETGLNYQKYHYRFAYILARRRGWFDIANIPVNLWFMLLETPQLTFDPVRKTLKIISNPEGNSILFLSPIFLTIFAAKPFIKKEEGYTFRPFVFSLWSALIFSSLPILLLSGTGWSQFGYRYTLDVTVFLIILSIFGIKGKINFLYFLACLFSVFVQTIGNIAT